ncbi:Mu transposase C-terminal domain-containing protein [Methylobacterium sp. V23]|uniref:Mu transposase C-terminal domain-containing protein n=1 Tax=Methylobacterium sp. V23 TaxID=2044878 RepID=UPI000CDB110B|nr:Mu transposase C-terminal domain-containing protein [Methylobacterium sp. V23]POR42179.1 hypothetical protein CRT23_15000 [Methylobacterium sp. V23]
MNDLFNMPHPRVPMLRFGRYDRIRIGSVEYGNPQAVEGGYVLHRVDAPDLAQEFSHEEIWLLSKRRDWTLDPDWYAPKSARSRLATGVASLDDLAAKELPDVVWKWQFCTRFVRKYEAGECNKTPASLKLAIAEIYKDLRVLEIAAMPPGRKPGKKPARGARTSRHGTARKPKAYAGNKTLIEVREPPSATTLLRWLDLLEKRGFRPASLRDGRYRSGCRTPRIQGEALKLMVKHGNWYATLERPTIANLHRDLAADIDGLNLSLPEAERIPCPSRKALSLYVAGLGRFHVHAGRYGIDQAKRRFAVITSGNVVVRPFERIEIDTWTVDLKTFLTNRGLWDRLSHKVRSEVGRMFLCTAIDVASKVITGACLSDTPSVAAALTVLRMTLTDKRAFGQAAGAALPWDQHATFEAISADGGPQFNNFEFINTVALLGQSPEFPSGGVPALRGTKESFFRTIGTQAVGRLPGKTFNNVVALAGYQSDDHLCIETPDLVALLTRWIVDAYHGSPHDGLGGETPHDAWNRLTRLYGLQPAPDRNKVRAIFGIPLTRRLGNGGIRVLGLRYWCEPLQAHFLAHGFVDMDVRLDAGDVSEISVRIGEAWHVASCTREGFEDVTMEAWIRTCRDLASIHAAGAAITEGAVHAAIRAANALTQEAMARAGISSIPPTEADVTRAENELMQGWTMPEIAPSEDVRTVTDPLDGGIPVTGVDRRGTPPVGPSDFTFER